MTILDIFSKTENDKIIADVYHKPTDTQPYLHFKSYHKNFMKFILYSLAHRIYNIISNGNLWKINQDESHQIFYQRSYTIPLINKGL